MEPEARFRALYAAFNRRDTDAVLATLAPDVDWPNAWEGGRVQGHAGVRDYWRRQWAAIDPSVEPTAVHVEGDGRVVVEVHQVARALDGTLIGEGDVRHVYVLRDGLIVCMDVEED